MNIYQLYFKKERLKPSQVAVKILEGFRNLDEAREYLKEFEDRDTLGYTADGFEFGPKDLKRAIDILSSEGGTTYNLSPKTERERWMEIIYQDEVIGECSRCKHRRGHWVIYGDGTQIIKCLKCKRDGTFVIDVDDTFYGSSHRYPPLSGDEIDKLRDEWSGYTKGQR